MVQHLTQKQIEDYCQRQLAANELLAVTDHLAECETCQQRVAVAGNGDAAFFDLRSQVFEEAGDLAHLTMQQTAAYVDKDLAGEELQMVEDHLGDCDHCVFAVNDLREFKNEIIPSIDHEYQPASTTSWWQRTLASLTTPFRMAPIPAFGGAALAILLLAAIVWLVWPTSRQPEPQNRGNPIAVSAIPTNFAANTT